MTEAPSQHLQPARRGRQLLSAGLTADAGSALLSHPASAIPQEASAGVADGAGPAQPLCPSHETSSDAVPLQHVEESTPSMVSATSDLPHDSTCPVPDSTTRQYPLPPPRDAPPLHAPRAIFGAQSSSFPLGPIKQPLQGGPPRNPLLPQAPLPQPQQLHPANQLSQSQQRFQQMLTAATAVGYCQGLRQGLGHGPAAAPLAFTTQQGQNSSQQPAQLQGATLQQHASLGDSMALPPASGHKRPKEAARPAQPPSKRQRLVYIAEPKPSAPPPSQGLLRFKCSIADILDAHWPGAAAEAARRQQTAQVSSAPCSLGVAPQMGSGSAESASAGAVPSRALPSCLGRGRRLLSVPPCEAPATLPTPPLPSLPAATADAASASTAAFESLSLQPEAPLRRRAMPPPQQRVTAHSVQQQVAAAQAAGWSSSSPLTAASQCPIERSSSAPRQSSASLHESPRRQPPAQPLAFPLSSFPQVMSQLLSEPSMHSMQAWVAAYQPPSVTSSQTDSKAPHQSLARPQKRARQGADSQQANSLATAPSADRSSAAPAAASAGSMFDSQQSSRLSSIQLLHLRARQHMSDADASSAAFSASTSCANKPTSLDKLPNQTHLQPGRVLQSQPECSGSHELPSQSSRGVPLQPPRDPGPPHWGGPHSCCPVGSEAGTAQHVYAPAGTRPQNAAMQALLARLTQERNASAVLPSLPLAAAAPQPTPAAAPQPTPAAVPASPHSAPAPPAAPPDSGLASLTLLDGVARHTGVSSSLSQQQPPDRVASGEGLGLLPARDSCIRPRDALPDCWLPLDNGRTASQCNRVPPMPAALPPPDPS